MMHTLYMQKFLIQFLGQTQKKSSEILMLNMLVFLAVTTCNSAHADVYIDLSKTDEIRINNIQSEQSYTVKIEEQVDVSLVTDVLPKKIMSARKLPYNTEVIFAASETSIEPALIHAVITVESKHNPYATSSRGAYGLMQLMPSTARRFKVLNKNDPKQNILAGAKYLRELLNLFKGDLQLTLAAYNAGPAAVQKYGDRIPPYSETLNYVPKVLKYYRQYL